MAAPARPPIELNGALVLVTGAGSGIGAATARSFAALGSRVLLVDIDEEAAKRIAKDLGPEADAHSYPCDVADWSAVAALADRIHAEHGPLDVLVNNAGVGMTGRFLDTSVDDWRWIRGVNLDGVVHGCYAFAPPMLERGRGHVVNVSSGLGYTPHATEPHYVATKAAVLALSQCLRADWLTRGVGVSAICPGVINTPIVDKTRYRGEQADEKTRKRTKRAFNRGHRPELVSAAIVESVRSNRAVVPVGWEARAGWFIQRVAPMPVKQLMARQQVR